MWGMKDWAYFLLLVGGLNWGLTLFGVNLVDMLAGAGSTFGKFIYGLVGASAVYLGYDKFK